MADKFPALDEIDQNLPEAGISDEADDFLAREKELVGDEFKTEDDKQVLEEDDDEFSEFKEQFPEVQEDEQEGTALKEEEEEVEDEDIEGFGNSNDSSKFEGESPHIKEWKERRDLEISTREKANEAKKKEIITNARQAIDDFYDNYNSKREQHSEEVLKEQEEFLEKRDGFLKRGTLWDRVGELVAEVGETGDGTRDKTRFKELLKKLKGKENAPGAGGYSATHV